MHYELTWCRPELGDDTSYFHILSLVSSLSSPICLITWPVSSNGIYEDSGMLLVDVIANDMRWIHYVRSGSFFTFCWVHYLCVSFLQAEKLLSNPTFQGVRSCRNSFQWLVTLFTFNQWWLKMRNIKKVFFSQGRGFFGNWFLAYLVCFMHSSKLYYELTVSSRKMDNFSSCGGEKYFINKISNVRDDYNELMCICSSAFANQFAVNL